LLTRKSVSFLSIAKVLVAFDIIIDSIGLPLNSIIAKADLLLVCYKPFNAVL
jgi:hypothetical protein